MADGTIQEVEVPYEIPESWEWVRVGNICSTNVGLTFKPSEVQESGIPVYKANNIKNGKICTLDLAFVSEKTTIKDSEWLNKKDILMAVRSGSKQLVGKTAVIENLETKTSFGAFMSVIRPISVSSAFMNYFFQSSHFRSQLDEANTTTIFQVTQKMLKETLIPLPPLAEQKRIVEQIKKALAKVDEYAESYNKLQQLDKEFPDKLKKSILQYAMQGKLVAQSPDDEPVEILLEKIKAEKQKLFEAGKLKKKDLAEMVVEKGDDNSPYQDVLYEIPKSWKWVRLGCVASLSFFPNISGDKIPNCSWVLDMEDIEKETGRLLRKNYKTEKSSYKSNKVSFSQNAVLYAKLRPNLKKVIVADEDGFATTELIPIKLFGNTSPEYIKHCMVSPFYYFNIIQSVYGVKMPRVNSTFLSTTLIPLPPLAEQKRIVAQIEQVFSVIETLV
ncbi:restriction endonuclease subunit S [Streptococcus equi]|uniref:restriction endonuclease subunit S n=1 Tax=Streptococcus equi TaxID=1336 RepID=UPI001E2B7D78|nr:restriction endonuclease subunit S [Streptococcus equi]